MMKLNRVQINILELVYTQTRNFATQKIELKYIQRDLCKNVKNGPNN